MNQLLGVLDSSRGRKLGCPELRNAVLQKKPSLHLFGHIHESYGVVEKYDILFSNASNKNGTRPIVIDVKLK